MSSPIAAEKAGVSRKQMNNLLNARHDPRLSLVEKVARVFDLAAWQILAYDMEQRPPDRIQVAKLLERYSEAEDAGRAAIMQVAEIASTRSG